MPFSFPNKICIIVTVIYFKKRKRWKKKDRLVIYMEIFGEIDNLKNK